MAKAQQGGGGGAVTGMIAFAGLWLASTVTLVILYTGQEDLKNHAQRMEAANTKLISRSERTSIELFNSARSGGPTGVGLLDRARADIAEVATGDRNDDPGAARSKLDQRLVTFRSDRIVSNPSRYQDVSYDKAMGMLYEAFKSEHALRTDAETRVAELGKGLDDYIQANTRQKSDFAASTQKLGEQFKDVEAKHGLYREERDKSVADLERDFEERRNEYDADLTGERRHNASLRKQVSRLEARLAAIQAELGDLFIGPKKLATARVADGKILNYFAGDDFVFIDLGQGDRLVLGLRFAVYDAGNGIPPDGRSKAQIEVVSIDARSAECRIVTQSAHAVIQVGDLIANPIYDPNRPVSFLVVGEFDLNHDGVMDPTGSATIEALITKWGGTLSAELTALLDFVVLGRAPRRPKTLAGDANTEAIARHKRQKDSYDTYMELVQSATAMQVPVLGQEAFLNFLGYSSRRAVR